MFLINDKSLFVQKVFDQGKIIRYKSFAVDKISHLEAYKAIINFKELYPTEKDDIYVFDDVYRHILMI